MRKLTAMVFVLGLTLSSVSFASEDPSGGDCKNKATTSVSKEEIISLEGTTSETKEDSVETSGQ